MARLLSHSVSAALLVCAVLGLAAKPACAQTTYILTNTSLDGSSNLPGDIVIGQDSTGTVNTSPTVALLTGSTAVDAYSYNSSHVQVNGGSISTAFLHGSTTFDLFSGTLKNHFYGYDDSTANISGGSIGFDLYARDHSVVNVAGGSVGVNAGSSGDSMLRFSGGSVGKGSFFADNSIVTISGGSFGQSVGVNFYMEDHSALTLIGNDLTMTDIGPEPGVGERFALGGRLLDGTDLTGYFLQEQGGFTGSVTLTNVPEPGSVALLGGASLTGAAVLRRRRLRRTAPPRAGGSARG